MTPSANIVRLGATGYSPPNPRYDKPNNRTGKTKIKALAKRFMAFRAAQREAHEPVDSFCRRGEDAPRFAYFD